MHLHLVTLHVNNSPQSVPLAAAFLQASVTKHFQRLSTVRVTIADFVCGTPVDTMVAKIAEERPEMVGFSLYVWNRSEVIQLTHRLRDLFPQMILLGGGPEATADPEGIMEESSFDLLIIGEGEGVLIELLQRQIKAQQLDDLQGIIRKKERGIVRSSTPPPLTLEDLPSPWLSGLIDNYIPQGVLWQLARGCSFGCEFCFDGMGTRLVRRFPLARVEAELDYLVSHGVKQIFVLDSTFNQDLKRTKFLLKIFRKKAPLVHFHFEIRYEFLDAESAQLFAAISCSLQIGLQSASPQVLEQVGRSFNPSDFKRKIALLNNSGATFGFDLIYGLPGDSILEFRKSLDFALAQYPNQLDIFPLAILPGTPLFKKALKLQLHHLSHPPYTILASPTFSEDDLTKARDLAIACDIFYSRGKAVAWFNGIVAILKLSPSALLLNFSDWIIAELGKNPDPAEFNDEQIWGMQKRFLNDLFKKHHVEQWLPLALNLIDYHYYYAAVAQSSPSPLILKAKTLERIDVLKTPLRNSASSRLATFQYDIEELIPLGGPQLTHGFSRLKPKESYAVLYPSDGQICTEPLPMKYFHLLGGLDGNNPPGLIAASLNITPDAARKFLQIALHEGIVEPPEK